MGRTEGHDRTALSHHTRAIAMPPLSASILIVDDDPDIQAVLADRLEALGYRVCTASTGRDGLALLEAEGPQLVLFAPGFPTLTGWTCSRPCARGPPTSWW